MAELRAGKRALKFDKEMLDKMALQTNSVFAFTVDSFCEYVRKYLELALIGKDVGSEFERSTSTMTGVAYNEDPILVNKKHRLFDLIVQCKKNAPTFDFRFVLLKCMREFCNDHKEVTFEEVEVLAKPISYDVFCFNADFLWDADRGVSKYGFGAYASTRKLNEQEVKLCFKSLMHFFLMTVYNEFANTGFKGDLQIDNYPISRVDWRRLCGYMDVCGDILNYEDLIVESVRECDECLRNCVTVWNYVRYPITSQYFEGATLFEDWALYFAEESGLNIEKIQNCFNPTVNKKEAKVIRSDKDVFCLDAVLMVLQYLETAELEKETTTLDQLISVLESVWEDYSGPNPIMATIDLLADAALISGLPDNIVLTSGDRVSGRSFLEAVKDVDLKAMSERSHSSFQQFVAYVILVSETIRRNQNESR